MNLELNFRNLGCTFGEVCTSSADFVAYATEHADKMLECICFEVCSEEDQSVDSFFNSMEML